MLASDNENANITFNPISVSAIPTNASLTDDQNFLLCSFDNISLYANGTPNANGGRGFVCFLHVKNGSVPENEFQVKSYYHPTMVLDNIGEYGSNADNSSSFVHRINGSMAWQHLYWTDSSRLNKDSGIAWMNSTQWLIPGGKIMYSWYADGGLVMRTGSNVGGILAYFQSNSTEAFSISENGQYKASGYTGTGVDYACFDASGNIIRQDAACA